MDDGLITTNNQPFCNDIFASINKTLKHTFNKEPADWYLGMRIDQNIVQGRLESVKLSQHSYMEQICKQNGISCDDINTSAHGKQLQPRSICTPYTEKKLHRADCPKEITPLVLEQQAKYRANVGALLFLTRCTLPQISYAVGRLGRFSSNSGPEHWKEMTHLLKYIRTVRNMGIVYTRPKSLYCHTLVPSLILSNWNKQKSEHFISYTDSDFAGCPDTLRSTSGGVVSWMGAAICWNSSLQACVTLSTAESEMVALSKGAQEVIWLRRFIGELMGGKITVPTKIYCDNQATLQLIDNRVHHSRTKHIALRQNFVREHKDSNELDPQYIATTLNISDMFTKPVNKSTMDSHIPLLTGMKPIYI